ncbi:epoxide hydrolase [Scenedesmus sp. PABB004]|nr:epoxide hydrolase [Scenedesmus sp. PABB004]
MEGAKEVQDLYNNGVFDFKQSRRIAVGDALPADAELLVLGDDGAPRSVRLGDVTSGRRVVLFGLPGAFTSVCSSKHVPEFASRAAELRDAGVSHIACLSVNDPWVMADWADRLGVDTRSVAMLADGEGLVHSRMGLLQHMPGLGVRALRYSILADDGKIALRHPPRTSEASASAAAARAASMAAEAAGGGDAFEPRPFTIAVPDEELLFLASRLESARFPDQLEGIAPWEDGTDLHYFKGFVEHWRTRYDWRAWEARLNALPQFTAAVRGVDLHFVHQRSPRPDATPLLLLHGWPGSYFEFIKLIPLLGDAFHIVAPSLPGYGWSSAPKQRGFGSTAIAATVDSLMARLGYARYIAQGGDWGAIICRALAKYHQTSCAAVHLNMVVASPRLTSPRHLLQLANVAVAPGLPIFLSAGELAGLKELGHFREAESAYQKIQGTKPQTLAYALQDSPVGLAAWILEKFRTWSDCGGDPDAALSKDEMLTNICIYWFGGRIASSMRLYKETLSNKAELGALFGGYTPTPTGAAIFPRELVKPPRSWAQAAYNIQAWTEMPRGGHFAALEQPELLAREVLAFGQLAASKGWL